METPLRTEADYDACVVLLDYVLDLIGGQAGHPMADVLEGLATDIECYEAVHYPLKHWGVAPKPGRPHPVLLAAALYWLLPGPRLTRQLQQVDDGRAQYELAWLFERTCQESGVPAMPAAVIADALTSYWGGWAGRYAHLEDWVAPARALLERACEEEGGAVRPGDRAPLTVEAIAVMIRAILGDEHE